MYEWGSVILQLLAEVAHIRLDNIGVPSEVVVPYVIEDLRLREHMMGIEQEIPQ
jgi:hypothetical protein